MTTHGTPTGTGGTTSGATSGTQGTAGKGGAGNGTRKWTVKGDTYTSPNQQNYRRIGAPEAYQLAAWVEKNISTHLWGNVDEVAKIGEQCYMACLQYLTEGRLPNPIASVPTPHAITGYLNENDQNVSGSFGMFNTYTEQQSPAGVR